ncbi:MAG: PAS domain S-box protein [Verrucomicrobiota bacterium]|nr:PAS domain S-box protein [Limisphaera sp.]MDW8382849.1 PAS domain S-box protein [Verrucomicrobiota bacterium]
MEGSLRILHLEDDLEYAAFVAAWLKEAGWDAQVTAVSDLQAFQRAINTGGFDLILSDYHLPNCTALDALALAREHCPEIPFVLISGTVGEDAAIESLRHGATDYVLKQWTDRLIPTLQRALHQAAEKKRLRALQDEITRKERLLRALTEHVHEIVALLDPRGRIRYASPATARVLGYDPAGWQGQDWCEFVHAEDVPRVRTALQQVLNDRPGLLRVEFRMSHRDGRWRTMEGMLQNRIEEPALTGLLMTCRDITERKQAEQQAAALARLGRQLNAADSHLDAARAIAAAAAELLPWDAFVLELWDPASETVIPLLLIDTLEGQPEEIPPRMPAGPPSKLARRVLEQGPLLLMRPSATGLLLESDPFGDMSRPSASMLWAPLRHGSSVEGLLSVQSYQPHAYTTQDLDLLLTLADHCSGALKRLRMEQALRRAEQQFRGLFEHSPEAIFVLDEEGRILDANAAARDLVGLDARSLAGRHWMDFLPLEQRPTARVIWQRPTLEASEAWEGHWLRNDGQWVPVEIRAGRLVQAGAPTGLLLVRDISDRKQAESALRDSERLFFSVWESSGDGMCLTDEQDRIVAVNEALCRLLERPREELEGQPLSVVHPAGPDVTTLLRQYRATHSTQTLPHRAPHRLTLHNGKVREIELSHTFIESPGRPPLLLTLFRDLTGQRSLEDQLRHAQKMEAIGQLAGGVAHDFNNLLTVIQGNATLLLSARNLSPAHWRAAEQICQAAERAANLTRQLLTFSRRQVAQPRTLDLNELVHQISRMLGRILGEHIVLRLQFAPQPAWVHADPGMLEQVVLNLVVNARDAMPEGGHLDLRVAQVHIHAEAAHLAPSARPGTWVCLEVADTGCGIPPENLKRIFEPFFTTKEVGKGTGLGLATVYGIVEQHQGWIDVESTVGRGSTFRVYLPARDTAEPSNENVAQVVPAEGGRETILVVEDETSVRELVAAVLQQHGYRVFQAANGPDALQLWERHRHEIDLLLTDMVMPRRINGRELAERLCLERPDLKVIFTSGYSAEVVGEDFLQRPGVVYLPKPYAPGELARLVRQTLDQPWAA